MSLRCRCNRIHLRLLQANIRTRRSSGCCSPSEIAILCPIRRVIGKLRASDHLCEPCAQEIIEDFFLFFSLFLGGVKNPPPIAFLWKHAMETNDREQGFVRDIDLSDMIAIQIIIVQPIIYKLSMIKWP